MKKLFLFDYKGERYHQYDGGLSYGGAQGCSAYAMYHAKAQLDNLVIKGGIVNSNGNTMVVSFLIPFDIINTSSERVQLSQDKIYDSNVANATGIKAEVSFNCFFKGDDYI